MNNYVDKLKKIIPEDANINDTNISKVFFQIRKGSNIKNIFYSEMMFITVAALLKLLYIEERIYIQKGKVYSKNLEGNFQNKIINSLSANINLKNSDITKKIFKNRKTNPNLLYYQSFNTYDSLKRRLNLMQQFGDTTQKSIVFLGDDELFSVFYALNSESYKRILVLDIDKCILEEIDKYSIEYNLNIETRKFDVFDENCIESEFDIFFASGLKNLAGLLLFVFTGYKFLIPSKQRSGYFTYYPYVSSLKDIEVFKDQYHYSLQKKLIDYGFYIEHLSVCDEINISESMILKLTKWILSGTDCLISNDQCFMDDIKDVEELCADPLFPYFSIKPINLARVKNFFGDVSKINNYIEVVKRLNKNDRFEA